MIPTPRMRQSESIKAYLENLSEYLEIFFLIMENKSDFLVFCRKLGMMSICSYFLGEYFLNKPINCTFVFKLSSQGLKRYLFYNNSSDFLELTKNFPREKLDQLIPSMHENNSLIPMKNFQMLFSGVPSEVFAPVLFFLAKKGVFEVYRRRRKNWR
jgi:hypothetical protein